MMYRIRAISHIAISNNMTNREILLEMYEKLWNADKDKWSWYAIVKDSLEKLEANKRCKHIKIEGESCRLNNNCTYPDCK